MDLNTHKDNSSSSSEVSSCKVRLHIDTNVCFIRFFSCTQTITGSWWKGWKRVEFPLPQISWGPVHKWGVNEGSAVMWVMYWCVFWVFFPHLWLWAVGRHQNRRVRIQVDGVSFLQSLSPREPEELLLLHIKRSQHLNRSLLHHPTGSDCQVLGQTDGRTDGQMDGWMMNWHGTSWEWGIIEELVGPSDGNLQR